MLHKHCNLNKWDIYNYTLPQVTELLKKAQKHIKFEVEIATAPFKGMGAMFGVGGTDNNEEQKTETTEEDIDFLENF